MVIVRLMGGLGNQMFQYAAGRRLARHSGVPLLLDLGWFSAVPANETPRSYGLDAFAIPEEVLATAAPEKQAAESSRIWRFLSRRLSSFGRLREVYEQGAGFDQTILSLRGNVRLIGFWQDERYFNDVAQLIRCEFLLRNQLPSSSSELAGVIATTDSVAVHVRRGDYLTNPSARAHHLCCGSEYYDKAMKHVATRVAEPKFFIFSDDTDWVREQMPRGYDIVVVENECADHPAEHLFLMSRCKHQIIANSSFSWWGGWLNENPRKLVVAPHQWFHGQEYRKELPPEWICL